MKLSEQVKPMSYLKAHAPEIIRTLGDNRQPVVITVHGEAKAVLQDVAQYEETQETLALLKVLALTGKQVEEGRVLPAAEAFARIRKRISAEPS
ncbi:type II toxin-antitoxin system prevent-host-death family antitoxin [Rhizobium lusitanum]|uniref:Antitoxin n=1 Tax=Rhizobium lusitanum TaxID=293958 RepID=A0A6L9UH34_9HYPH|nr:type II toxin-antitoxin system Phd/YefM family antitoxin [Rhizobium lusitanum]NEI74689.1 type II toxin-antitoxin system prevent-host-death family antitoxin [Rhizobium lusitanum]